MNIKGGWAAIKSAYKNVELAVIVGLIGLKLAWDEVHARWVNHHKAKSEPPPSPFEDVVLDAEFPTLYYKEVDHAMAPDTSIASDVIFHEDGTVEVCSCRELHLHDPDSETFELEFDEGVFMEAEKSEEGVEFASLSSIEVRARINGSRDRNAQGGMDWSRWDYLAYALARPVMRWSEEKEHPLQISDETRRQVRVMRHEQYSNDNINHYSIARILWVSGLVRVNGVLYQPDVHPPVPHELFTFVTRMVPWHPKPPRKPNAEKAA